MILFVFQYSLWSGYGSIVVTYGIPEGDIDGFVAGETLEGNGEKAYYTRRKTRCVLSDMLSREPGRITSKV